MYLELWRSQRACTSMSTPLLLYMLLYMHLYSDRRRRGGKVMLKLWFVGRIGSELSEGSALEHRQETVQINPLRIDMATSRAVCARSFGRFCCLCRACGARLGCTCVGCTSCASLCVVGAGEQLSALQTRLRQRCVRVKHVNSIVDLIVNELISARKFVCSDLKRLFEFHFL